MAYTLEDILQGRLPAPRPLGKQEALASLARAKGQMRRRRQSIRQIHAGRLPEDELQTILLRRVLAGFTPLDTGGRDAFLRLLLHVEDCAPDLLSTAWGTDRFGPRPGNTLVDGLAALARFSDRWLQPVDRWRPRGRQERSAFIDLANHLLARYGVPEFLHSAWFRGDGEAARRQQTWFVHVGAGGNLRTADHLPLQLTKRMAHQVLLAPADVTVERALRRGQVLGWDGSPELAAAICATRLGRSFEREDFWSTVVHYLARNAAAIDVDLVAAIVGYLQHQRHTPQDIIAPDGTLTVGPPAEPNLSMKSRSLPKLLRHVERWRQAWSQDLEGPEEEEANPANGRKIAYLYLEDVDAETGEPLVWTIQELRTGRSLANEGHAMGHCLSSKAVSLGTTSVWSVQVRDGSRTRRVLTVAIDIAHRSVSQARGRFNANPDRDIDGPRINLDEGGGGDRFKGRLSPRERELLRQSHRVLRLWLDRETIAYSKYDL